MRRISLNAWIYIGALLGVGLGILLALHRSAAWSQTSLQGLGLIGGLFIDLLKMVMLPLTFTSVVVGIANLQAQQKIHRVWITTLIYSMLSLACAVSVGILAANIFAPGRGLRLEMLHTGTQSITLHDAPQDLFSQFVHGLFMNPFAALAQGKLLSALIFALLLGIALVAGGERFRHLRALMQEAFDLCLMIVGWIMWLAPIGIFALLAQMVATEEPALLFSVIGFVTVVLGTTLFHGAIVLPALLYFLTRMSPWHFLRGAKDALLTAFATSSSSATMPVTLQCTEHKLGVNPAVSGFVIPLGAHLNMDGTALYEAAAALFVANLCGIELSLLQQIIVCFMAMLVSIGAAGIPSAGMATMAVVLQTVGLPLEALAILLPLDRPLDTLRTAVNVEGDMVACVVVDKYAVGKTPDV